MSRRWARPFLRVALLNPVIDWRSEKSMYANDVDGLDGSAHEHDARWTAEMVVITLLALGVGVLLAVATVTQASWLLDLESLWGRSCVCLRMLVN